MSRSYFGRRSELEADVDEVTLRQLTNVSLEELNANRQEQARAIIERRPDLETLQRLNPEGRSDIRRPLDLRDGRRVQFGRQALGDEAASLGFAPPRRKQTLLLSATKCPLSTRDRYARQCVGAPLERKTTAQPVRCEID
jgi:hypothetical protein